MSHFAIFSRSGNALSWFTEEAEARASLARMLADSPDADVDLVEFADQPRRLSWSRTVDPPPETAGDIAGVRVTIDGRELTFDNGTDDRVPRA